MGIISNFQRNVRNAANDAFSSVGEDYNINLESRDLQRISKSRMISEAKQIASSKIIDTDSGIFADFKNFGRNLKQQLFGTPNTNRDEMDSWDFDDIGFSSSGLAGRSGLSAGALNDSAMKSSQAIGGAVISGTNRQIKASSILMSGLINEVKVGNTILKGILDSLNDKTFREASLKYYTESLVALKNIERGVQFQVENKDRDDGDALKPSEFAKQLASLDLHGLTKTTKNVLLSTVDKQGMIKLVGGVATSLFESLMGEDGLKSMFKTGMEQILKKKMGESFGMDMEAFMSDPAMLMERLLQRGKVSNSSIIRMFSKRTASTVNSAFDTTQEVKDPKGKANFDVAAHTALTHVLPHKLDKIYSAITGSQLETYDYTKNRWVTVEDAAAMFAKERPDVDTAIGDVLSKIKDLVKDKKMDGFTDANGELMFGKSMAKLMSGLASKGGELKGIANANEKAIADEYGLTIPEAVRLMEMVRMLMSDKDGNDTIASADRDILNLVNEVQSYNAKMKDSYSANRLFQNGAIDNITLAQGDNVLGKLLGKTTAGSGTSIMSALAEVEGYGSVLKVFAVNGFGGGSGRSKNGKGSKIINTTNSQLDMGRATERISKGASVEYSNYLNDMNKMKESENETSGTRAQREKDALQSMTDSYNKKNGTNLKPEEIKTMMELYSYLRGTGMGGPSIFQMYKDMNGGGSKDWDAWSESERNKKINPQSWEDIDLSLFTDDVKDRASHYTNKGSMTKRSFSLEDPIESSVKILKDLYRDPNMVGKIHGGAGVGLGAVMGTIFQKTTGIGGIYAPIIGTMLGGAMSMSSGFKNMSNQLLGEAGDEQVGGVKRRQRVMEKIFQQVLPSVIGGSVAGKFAGKVIGKFLPYGSILGPIGSLVVGAVTGGLLYQTNLMSKALGDTKFGKFMEKIPILGQYFKVRKDEKEAGTTSTDASFKDLVYGNMNEERTEYNSDIADDTKQAYEDYNEVMKAFMDELRDIREERSDIDQDITDYNNEKAEIKASNADASTKRDKLSALNKKYAIAIKEYKNINIKLSVLGDKYKKLLKEAIKGKLPDDKIDALVDSAIATGFVKGSKDHVIAGAKSTFRSAKRGIGDTFSKFDSWLMGDEEDEDVENAKVDANKDFAKRANKWFTQGNNESFAGTPRPRNSGDNRHRAGANPNSENPNSGEGEGGPQAHYYQKDAKWANMADSSPILNMSTSGCAIMTAMSVTSRLLDMKVENPKYFIKVASKFMNKNGIDSGYFETLFRSLGASVVRYKNVQTMSTEARSILFTNMGKAWGIGGSVIALINQPDRGNKHFVSFSRISTTLHKATMHDPNMKEPIDVNLADLAPVIHELIYVVPEKNTVELAYKKKVVTKDELEGADYDTSGLGHRSLWERATDSRIGKHDLGDLGKKFNNLGDDFLKWVENDDPPEGKIANALLYGVVGAVDMLTATVKGVAKGLTRGFKMALKAMGPLGQLMSVGWKLGMGATKMLWGAGKLGAKLLWGAGKFAKKIYKKGKNKGAIVKELRSIFNTDIQLRADGVIVDTANDSEVGRLMANGDIMDMDGKNVIGNIPMDLMTASGMDKSINAGGKRNFLGLIGEKGLKGAWQTVRDRKNKKLEDAAKENAEKANKFTRGETMFEDMRDALAEVLADTPIRTEVEGGMLDAVGATGATDVDATEDMIRSAESAPAGKKSPKVMRNLKAKYLRIKRALKGRTLENIDKFQDEEAEREERKIRALEGNRGEGGSGMGALTPLLIGILAPIAGMLPGIMAMYQKFTGGASNLNQLSSLWQATKGGGKLVGNLTKKIVGGVSKGAMKVMNVATFGGAGKIAKLFKGSMGLSQVSKGVDITLDAVEGVGPKARKIVMDIFAWLLEKGSKILPAKWVAKVTGLVGPMTSMIQKQVGKLMTNPKISPAFAATKNIPFANIAFAIWDFIKGYKDAEEFLGLPDEAVTTGMRIAVALANGFVSVLAAFITSAITVGSGGIALGASVIINMVIGAINPGWLAKKIYNLFGDLDEEAGKQLKDRTGKETKVTTSGDTFSFSGNEQAKITESASQANSSDDWVGNKTSEGQSATQRIGNTFKNIFSPGDTNGSNSGFWAGITGTETDDTSYESDGTFPLPDKNSSISSTYGLRRHPISGEIKNHPGIDFAVATGTPIYAMADGKIEKAGMGTGGAGLRIVLVGKDGIVYKYMHLHAIFVKEGQEVTKGQKIATSGGDPKKDGKNAGGSTGAHLHFQMEKDGKPFDPIKALQIDHANILKGPNNKENERYLASNPQTAKNSEGAKPTPAQNGAGEAAKGSGYDGMSKQAEAAIIAIPALLNQLIAAVKSNAPKGESNGSDSPIDFNALLQGMRGASGGGTPVI